MSILLTKTRNGFITTKDLFTAVKADLITGGFKLIYPGPLKPLKPGQLVGDPWGTVDHSTPSILPPLTNTVSISSTGNIVSSIDAVIEDGDTVVFTATGANLTGSGLISGTSY